MPTRRIALGLLLVLACDAPTSAAAGEYRLVNGWTPASTAYAIGVEVGPPRVRVLDGDGRPRVGVRVAFSVVRGNGLVPNPFQETDEDGYATATWRTGVIAGTQVLRAFVPSANDGTSVNFVISVSAGPAVAMNFSLQTAGFDRGTSRASQIVFRDSVGNVVPAPGTVSYATADAGIATVSTVGSVNGVQRGVTTLTATSASLADTALAVIRSGDPTMGMTPAAVSAPSWRPVFLPSRVALLPGVNTTGLSRFDAVSFAELPTALNLPGATLDLAVSADGTRAVATSAAAELYLIDVPNNTVLRTIPVATRALRVLVDPAGAFAYVTYDTATGPDIGRINLATDEVTDIDLVGSYFQGIALSPDGSALFLSSLGGALYRLATATLAVTHYAEPLGTPQGIAVSPDGASLFVARETGPMRRYSTANLALTGTSPSSAVFFDVILTANGDYVVGSGPSGIRILDPTTLDLYYTVPYSGTWRRAGRDPGSPDIWIGSGENFLMRLSF